MDLPVFDAIGRFLQLLQALCALGWIFLGLIWLAIVYLSAHRVTPRVRGPTFPDYLRNLRERPVSRLLVSLASIFEKTPLYPEQLTSRTRRVLYFVIASLAIGAVVPWAGVELMGLVHPSTTSYYYFGKATVAIANLWGVHSLLLAVLVVACLGALLSVTAAVICGWSSLRFVSIRHARSPGYVIAVPFLRMAIGTLPCIALLVLFEKILLGGEPKADNNILRYEMAIGVGLLFSASWPSWVHIALTLLLIISHRIPQKYDVLATAFLRKITSRHKDPSLLTAIAKVASRAMVSLAAIFGGLEILRRAFSALGIGND